VREIKCVCVDVGVRERERGKRDRECVSDKVWEWVSE